MDERRPARRRRAAAARAAAALAAAVTVLLAPAFLAPSPAAAEGDVTLEAVPQTLAVSPDGYGRLAVVVRNGTAAPLRHLRITAASTGVTVTPAGRPPALVAPATSVVLRYLVRLADARLTPRQVLVRAGWVRAGRPGGTATAFTVSRFAPDPVDQLASVQVASGLKTLDDVRGGDVYLLVRNTAARPLLLRSVQTSAAHFVRMRRQASAGCPAPSADKPPPDPERLRCRIPPGGELTLRYAVSAHHVDRTGSDVLVFAVTLAPVHGGRPFTLVATHDVTTGLFGESELATLFQLPSLLLLPGFAALVLLAVLWRAGARPSELSGKEFAYPPTTAGFWCLTVLGSALVSTGYWLVTGHDVLRALTVDDALWLALVGPALPLLVWVPVAGALRWRADRRTPRAGQDALTVLQRLGKGDAPAKLPVVSVDGAANLRLLAERGGSLLVAPRIRYRLTSADAELESSINAALAEPALEPVASCLVEASRHGKVTVSWDESGPATEPFVATDGAVHRDGRSDALVWAATE